MIWGLLRGPTEQLDWVFASEVWEKMSAASDSSVSFSGRATKRGGAIFKNAGYLPFVALLAGMAASIGCGTDPAKSLIKRFAKAAEADVEHVIHYPKAGIELLDNKWQRGSMRVVPESIRYDVQKTDSVVSPLKAIIEFQVFVRAGGLGNTREEAASKSLSKGGVDKDQSYRNYYDFVEGKWILRKCLKHYSRDDPDAIITCDVPELANALKLDGLDISK